MTLGERVSRARAAIGAAGVRAEDAGFDAEVLARRILGCDRAGFVVRLRDQEPQGFEEAFEALVARRCRREPVAYIVGEREFWGLAFEVTPDVLIPRPETELIVEAALELFPAGGRRPRIIVDVGTGSGCLAVALALEFDSALVIATDISEAALAVARRNAAANGAQAIDFRAGDLLEPVTETADLIVSNPPYVASGDEAGLIPEVGRHEPHVALFGGSDGLQIFARLLPQAAARIHPEGRLIVEVGYDQDDRVAAIAAPHGWTLSHVRHDLQAITRTLVFTRQPRG